MLAGIESRVYPNLLRAGIATHLLNPRENPAVVQHLMGHRSLKTTMIYNRTSPEDAKRLIRDAWTKLGSRDAPVPKDWRKELGEALMRGEIGVGELRSLLGVIDSAKKHTDEVGGYS